jgi:hypothetical protein
MNYVYRLRNVKVAKFKPSFTEESFALQQAFANRVLDTVKNQGPQDLALSCPPWEGTGLKVQGTGQNECLIFFSSLRLEP